MGPAQAMPHVLKVSQPSNRPVQLSILILTSFSAQCACFIAPLCHLRLECLSVTYKLCTLYTRCNWPNRSAWMVPSLQFSPLNSYIAILTPT